ncbi:MAG: hypothetical protein J5811_04660 [Lachnospiraceae bacterium]|nr:hypothetical protein [Lachnospiraceae bacterium]
MRNKLIKKALCTLLLTGTMSFAACGIPKDGVQVVVDGKTYTVTATESSDGNTIDKIEVTSDGSSATTEVTDTKAPEAQTPEGTATKTPEGTTTKTPDGTTSKAAEGTATPAPTEAPATKAPTPAPTQAPVQNTQTAAPTQAPVTQNTNKNTQPAATTQYSDKITGYNTKAPGSTVAEGTPVEAPFRDKGLSAETMPVLYGKKVFIGIPDDKGGIYTREGDHEDSSSTMKFVSYDSAGIGFCFITNYIDRTGDVNGKAYFVSENELVYRSDAEGYENSYIGFTLQDDGKVKVIQSGEFPYMGLDVYADGTYVLTKKSR